MSARRYVAVITAVLLLGCMTGKQSTVIEPVTEVRTISLPGGTATGITMDHMAYDRSRHRVWVPAGNTGSVDVVDCADAQVTRIDGFATAEIEQNGKKRTVGPSSATVGDRYVYIGNRAGSSVCAIKAESLSKGPCVKLDSTPDGLIYVGTMEEVWATTPQSDSIAVIDAPYHGLPSIKTEIRLDGAPESVAFDDWRGIVYTNLGERDRTLSVDSRTKNVTRSWPASCGEGGPKGLAVDRSLNFLLLACSDRVKVLDASHDGQELSAIDGAGVDDIAYLEFRRELYVGAAKAAKLIVASLDTKGWLKVKSEIRTALGARNPVVTDEGVAYLTDSPEGKLLVVLPQVPGRPALPARTTPSGA
jgi:DNA-binding beta-propeller fold protein YncE